MGFEPFNWQVIVLGSWNRAILTPNGISERLFEIPQGTPVQVQVPIDMIGLPQVKHNGLMVTAGSHRLIVTVERPTFPNLHRAQVVARRALASLPETPVSAAGINVRYRGDDAPGSLDVTETLDTLFADVERVVVERTMRRTLKQKLGVANLDVSINAEGECVVAVNFHCDVKGELAKFLERSADDIHKEIDVLIKQGLGLELEDSFDDERK